MPYYWYDYYNYDYLLMQDDDIVVVVMMIMTDKRKHLIFVNGVTHVADALILTPVGEDNNVKTFDV